MNNDIIFEVKNNLAVIRLNRPQALNAISGAMYVLLKEKLLEWRDDEYIKAVLIRSNCEKAFCAGGDIRSIYDNKSKPPESIFQYFQLEYEIDQIIFHYPKPYIALIHGVTMGGGVGISIHASHCVAADDLRWAMPETLIGFFPDVGVTYELSRLSNYIGTYLALTGHAIDAQTALELKLITHKVPHHFFDELEKKLANTLFAPNDYDVVTEIIQFYGGLSNDEKHYLPKEKIAACFSFLTLEEIMQALQKDGSEWAKTTYEQLSHRSPTSLKVTLQQLKYAESKTPDAVIAMDLHIAKIMLENHDFFEGIRAAIIDKDKNPKWKPATLAEVSDEMVKKYFVI